MLRPDQARAHYDRLGADQNRELRYAQPAFDALLDSGCFDAATDVLEIGCGTGTLASGLLSRHAGLTYTGLDISGAMTGLTYGTIGSFGARARVLQADATVSLPFADRSMDRVVAAYVLDLLTFPAMRTLFRETRRVLRPGGLFCAITMTPGGNIVERGRMLFWQSLHRIAPRQVGGCRPVRLKQRMIADGWPVQKSIRVTADGLSSELVIAGRSPSNN